MLTGTGTLRQQLTSVDPPRGYDYRITGITGPTAPLVAVMKGEWRFEPVGAVTKVSWQWTVAPRSSAANWR